MAIAMMSHNLGVMGKQHERWVWWRMDPGGGVKVSCYSGYSSVTHKYINQTANNRAVRYPHHHACVHVTMSHRYMESSLYLARLLISCGEYVTASDLLQQLDADLEAHELTLPEGQGAQMTLLLDKARLYLLLGQRGAFASQLLPQFMGLIDQAENNAAVVQAAKKVRYRGGGG